MKYLVIATPRRETPLPPHVIADMLMETRDWLSERIEEGSVDTAYGFVNGGGMGIVNIDSPEELNKFLLDSPSFTINDFDVRPLANPESSLENAAGALRQAAQSLGVHA